MSTTLLEIGQNVRALADLIDEMPDGELTPCAEAALETWWAEYSEGQAEDKLDSYCKLVEEFTARAAAARESMERLAKLVKAREGTVERLKDRMQLYMEMTSQRRIETDNYQIRLCKNGGKLKVNKPDDPKQLPAEYQRVTIEADTDAIRAALESGQDVPSCSLQARGAHVRIG